MSMISAKPISIREICNNTSWLGGNDHVFMDLARLALFFAGIGRIVFLLYDAIEFGRGLSGVL